MTFVLLFLRFVCSPEIAPLISCLVLLISLTDLRELVEPFLLVKDAQGVEVDKPAVSLAHRNFEYAFLSREQTVLTSQGARTRSYVST